MKLNLYKHIERNVQQELHPKFLLLRDNEQLIMQRTILESWTDGFLDRDNKIVDEFQKNFHSSFWEFYLYRVLTEYNFILDMSKEMPDFIVTAPFKMNIEAVIPNIKDGGRTESDRTLEETLGGLNPFYKEKNYEEMLNDAIIRQYGSIYAKSQKYLKNYSNKSWFDIEAPFVLALASFDQVNYGREYYFPLMSILYGAHFDGETAEFIKRKDIVKENGTKLSLGIFTNKSYEHISAIMYTCTLTLGKLTAMAISSNTLGLHNLNRVIHIREDFEEPRYKVALVGGSDEESKEDLTDGLFIFHNPNAKARLPKDAFKGSNIVEVCFDNGIFSFNSEHLPLVARINSSKLLIDHQLEDIIKSIHINYNT